MPLYNLATRGATSAADCNLIYYLVFENSQACSANNAAISKDTLINFISSSYSKINKILFRPCSEKQAKGQINITKALPRYLTFRLFLLNKNPETMRIAAKKRIVAYTATKIRVRVKNMIAILNLPQA